MANLIDREIKKIESEIAGLQQMAEVYAKTPEFGDASSPEEVTFTMPSLFT